MSELKTKKNNLSVRAFLDAIEDDAKRKDAKAVAKLLRAVTGKTAKMWGTSIVGYDSYHYEYASGRSGDWPIIGFSPRKTALTLYVMPGFSKYSKLMAKLGKYKTGKGCLYIKKLDDIDLDVLRQLAEVSVADMRKKYPRWS